MSETEPSPGSLETPKSGAQTMNRIVLWIVCGVGMVIAGVLLYSVFTPPEQPKNDTAIQQHTTTGENKPLTGNMPAGSGLSIPAPPPAPKTGSAVNVPQTPSVPVLSPEAQARKQDLEQLRRMRMQQELAGLQAPLSVSLTGMGEGGATRASPSQSAPSMVAPPRTVGNTAASRPDASLTTPNQQYDSTDRRDKEDFLASRSAQSETWRLGHTRVPGSLCEIKTGTVIPGIMVTGINSDLPGKLIGQVSQHVYDTATGKQLIIPQGSRLFGMYDSRVAMGQSRVLIAWNRIIFPDGSSVDLETMPGSDEAGYAGFTDEVDNHYLRIFGSSILMSLITGGMSYSVDSMGSGSSSTNDSNPSMRDEMGTALASQLGQASVQLLQQNMSIKPTLEIRSGYRFNVVLIKDLVFDQPYKAMR